MMTTNESKAFLFKSSSSSSSSPSSSLSSPSSPSPSPSPKKNLLFRKNTKNNGITGSDLVDLLLTFPLFSSAPSLSPTSSPTSIPWIMATTRSSTDDDEFDFSPPLNHSNENNNDDVDFDSLHDGDNENVVANISAGNSSFNPSGFSNPNSPKKLIKFSRFGNKKAEKGKDKEKDREKERDRLEREREVTDILQDMLNINYIEEVGQYNSQPYKNYKKIFKPTHFYQFKKDNYFLSFHAVDLANWLTLFEHELFQKISPAELDKGDWNNKDKTTHVRQLILRQNFISKWVGTEVILTPNFKEKIVVIKRFLDIAEYLRQIDNLNTLIEIIAGLKQTRMMLKKTWAAVPKRYVTLFDELASLLKPTNNFSVYRKVLESVSPPCLPYIGIYLKDLSYLEESQPDYEDKENNIINFAKCRAIMKIYSDIKFRQSVCYDAVCGLEGVKNYFDNVFILPDDKMKQLLSELSNQL